MSLTVNYPSLQSGMHACMTDATHSEMYRKFVDRGELASIPMHHVQPTTGALVKPALHERHDSNDTAFDVCFGDQEESMEDAMDVGNAFLAPAADNGWASSHTTSEMRLDSKRSASVSSLSTLAGDCSIDDCMAVSTCSLSSQDSQDSQDSDTTMVDLETHQDEKFDLLTRQERLERLNNLGKHTCFHGQFSDEVVLPGDMEEYGKEHLQNLLDKEKDPNTKCNPNYLTHQPHIDWKCRTILVLWLVEVHQEFNLRPETLYLATQILDRYLSRRVIVREQLQLLGLTSLWIAAKHEEVHGRVPTLDQLVWICCDAFKTAQFKSMELDVCGVLGYQFNVPVPETFLKLQVAFIAGEKLQDYTSQAINLARYLMELSLVHKRFMVVPPSILSISSFVLAEALLQNKTWPCKSGLVHDTSVKLFRVAVDACTTAPAIYNKYNEETFENVSSIIDDFVQRGLCIQVGDSNEVSAVYA